MLKIALLVLVAISIPMSAFAEPFITLTSQQTTIESLDSVLVLGKATDVTRYKPVTLTVLAPDGEVVYSPQVPLDGNGEFKRLIHHPLPSFKQGTYTIIASHPDTQQTAQIQFTVKGSEISSGVTDSRPDSTNVITMSAETVVGSDKIVITGHTESDETDITFAVTSPNGNLVYVAQVTPKSNGEFTAEIITGGPLWLEDGMYTITANQGIASQFKHSIKVDISNGVVVPEFGTIAVMILAVAIVSIIAVSAKSRLSIIPRY